MEFEYRVESKKSFPEAVAAVEAKTAEKGVGKPLAVNNSAARAGG